MLWTLFPAFIVLVIVQEMNARMGIVTGKGLADLIRENAGVKITFFIFVALLIADLLNTATEFAGVAGSMQIFGVSKYIAVPIVAFVVWIMVGLSLWSQRLNGILLPVVLICMMLIVNKKEVMGDHTNKPYQNLIGWTAIAVLVLLSVFMVVSFLFQG